MAASVHLKIDEIETLITEFDDLYAGYQQIEKSAAPSNSHDFQVNLKKLVDKAIEIVNGVNKQSIFSENESLSDVPCDHLRFFLLPALLGYFISKQSAFDSTSDDAASLRSSVVEKSKVYYKDFLRLCRLYGVTTVPEETAKNSENEDEENEKSREFSPKEIVTKRNMKIQRYQSSKLLDERISNLYSKVNMDHVDESDKREYFVALIDKWVLSTLDELQYLDDEIQILKHMLKVRENKEKPTVTKPKPKPNQTFIITKTRAQKTVFGLGYPSVPIYSIEEHYEAQIRKGIVPPVGGQTQESEEAAEERKAVVKEYNIEVDDPDELKKAREWDEFKDDHRRGWGNRKNMG